jgi:hypothetical protein
MRGNRFPLASAGLAALSLLATFAMPAKAASVVTFDGSDTTRKASVKFEDLGGGVLKVTLTNTSTKDVLVPVDVLTAVFFDSDFGALTRVSADLAIGSSVVYGTGPSDGNVGGEWAYKTGLHAPSPSGTGVSSSGLGLFGPGDRFNDNNLYGPADPDGLQYGITSAGDNIATGNKGVTKAPLIKNSVVFRFSSTGSFDLSSISNVWFQYGTQTSEPEVPGTLVFVPGGNPNTVPVPTPATAGAGMIVLGGFAGLRAIRRRRTIGSI